ALLGPFMQPLGCCVIQILRGRHHCGRRRSGQTVRLTPEEGCALVSHDLFHIKPPGVATLCVSTGCGSVRTEERDGMRDDASFAWCERSASPAATTLTI